MADPDSREWFERLRMFKEGHVDLCRECARLHPMVLCGIDQVCAMLKKKEA